MKRLKIEKPKPAEPEKKLGGVSPQPIVFGLIAIFLLTIIFWGAAKLFFFTRSAARGVPAEMPGLEIAAASGEAQVLDSRNAVWLPAERGAQFKVGDLFKSGKGSEADLILGDKIRLRIKQNSEISWVPCPRHNPESTLCFKLNKGKILAATQRGFSGGKLSVETPGCSMTAHSGYFIMESDGQAGRSVLGVMRGQAAVSDPSNPQTAPLGAGALQVVDSIKGNFPESPRALTRDEWESFSEIYELTEKSAAEEADQLSLSRGAGSLFEFVIDHGSFFTPDFGFARRDFFKDPSSETPFLEIEYDVFPTGSLAGMYLKTRDLDLAQFSHLEFEMRQSPEERAPQAMRIEVKSKTGVLRAFAAKLPRQNWAKFSFPLQVKKSTLATEVTIVFQYERVGEFKKGAVQLRNINLIRAPDSSTVAVQNAANAPSAQETKEVLPLAPLSRSEMLKDPTEAVLPAQVQTGGHDAAETPAAG